MASRVKIKIIVNTDTIDFHMADLQSFENKKQKQNKKQTAFYYESGFSVTFLCMAVLDWVFKVKTKRGRSKCTAK
jgi:hypothetical protein